MSKPTEKNCWGPKGQGKEEHDAEIVSRLRVPSITDPWTTTEAVLKAMREKFPECFTPDVISAAEDILGKMMLGEIDKREFPVLIKDLRPEIVALISLTAFTEPDYFFSPWEFLTLPEDENLPYQFRFASDDEELAFMSEPWFSQKLVDFYVELAIVALPWCLASEREYNEYHEIAFYSFLMRNILALDAQGKLNEEQIDDLLKNYPHGILWHTEYGFADWRLYYHDLLVMNPEISKRVRGKAQTEVERLINLTSGQKRKELISELESVVKNELKSKDKLPYFDCSILWRQIRYLLDMSEGLPRVNFEAVIALFEGEKGKKAELIKEYICRGGYIDSKSLEVYTGWIAFLQGRPEDKRGFMKKNYSTLLSERIDKTKEQVRKSQENETQGQDKEHEGKEDREKKKREEKERKKRERTDAFLAKYRRQ